MTAPSSPRAALISIREAAEILGISPAALYDWTRRPREGGPRVPHVRLGRRVLVRRDWVDWVVDGGNSPAPALGADAGSRRTHP